MRPGKAGAAAPARLSLPVVRKQLELELSGLSRAGAVVADRGAARRNRRPKDALELRVKASVLVRREPVRRLRWIDARREQRLVGVDVSYPGEMSLIHDDLLDRL